MQDERIEGLTNAAPALVLPYADLAMMNRYLAAFAGTIPDDVHVVMVLDGAGWHSEKALDVPTNITLVALPPYSPQLNPVERLCLYLRETSLSLCVFRDRQAIIDACCDAWNRATRDPSRIRSLCNYPYIKAVSSQPGQYKAGVTVG